MVESMNRSEVNSHVEDNNQNLISIKDADMICLLSSGCNRKKVLWTKEEDDQLRIVINQNSSKDRRGLKWTEIAKSMKGRSGKQCRERWVNHLKPEVKKGGWTHEEDELILQKQAELGNQWTQISKFLGGRTDNDVKNRWHSTSKRQKKLEMHTKQKMPKKRKLSSGLPKHNLNQGFKSMLAKPSKYNYDKVDEIHATSPNRFINKLQSISKSSMLTMNHQLPKIFWDVDILGKSYCSIISPVRKDDKSSIAREIHDLRLRTQKTVYSLKKEFNASQISHENQCAKIPDISPIHFLHGRSFE